MHIDENKKFDKRNIEKNIKNGMITEKDYELFLSKLPDISDKLFSPEEEATDSDELELRKESEVTHKKRGTKKRSKGKGK